MCFEVVPEREECVTHGLQRPGAGGTKSGGTPELALPLACAGAGAGVDGFFLEVHHDPPSAKSDAATQITPEEMFIAAIWPPENTSCP